MYLLENVFNFTSGDVSYLAGELAMLLAPAESVCRKHEIETHR